MTLRQKTVFEITREFTDDVKKPMIEQYLLMQNNTVKNARLLKLEGILKKPSSNPKMGIYRKFKEDTKMKSKEMTSKEILKKIKEKACKNYCNYICFLNEDETQLARKSQLKAYELIDLYEEISGRNILSDISKIAWDKYYGENEN